MAPINPEGEAARRSLAQSSERESCLRVGPRFHCHQLVVANNVLSVNSYVAHTDGTVKCRAGGGVCVVSSPAYFVIAPSVSLLGPGEEEGRGATCFKLCAVTRVAGLALNFKQNVQGGGNGGVLCSREEEEGDEKGGLKLFGIQQHT